MAVKRSFINVSPEEVPFSQPSDRRLDGGFKPFIFGNKTLTLHSCGWWEFCRTDQRAVGNVVRRRRCGSSTTELAIGCLHHSHSSALHWQKSDCRWRSYLRFRMVSVPTRR